jgi:hypothetical protein
VPRATSVVDARAARAVLASYVTAANMPETTMLLRPIDR